MSIMYYEQRTQTLESQLIFATAFATHTSHPPATKFDLLFHAVFERDKSPTGIVKGDVDLVNNPASAM
jgi:hypothetical protein